MMFAMSIGGFAYCIFLLAQWSEYVEQAGILIGSATGFVIYPIMFIAYAIYKCYKKDEEPW